MALPFFNDDENRELIQRISLAQEDERDRHRDRFGAIYSDYVSRGLSSSTACFGDQWREKLEHHEKLTEIAINEVFRLVEATDRRLTERDETAVIEAFALPLTQAIQSYAREQERGLRERGLTGGGVVASMTGMWNVTTAQAEEKTIATVRTRARDWDRKRRQAKKQRCKEWLDRIPRWWPILFALGGAALGWVAKSLVQNPVMQEEQPMGDLKWLDEYSGQSTEELLALEGKYRTDSLIVAFDQAAQQKWARVGDEGLSQEERIILAVEALESEVNNGGYDQFFFNSSREYAPMIVEALNRIGCPGTAAITQDAITALGIRGAVTEEAIAQVMKKEDERRSQRLNACDERYFAEAGDLAEPLLEFIKANRVKIKLHN